MVRRRLASGSADAGAGGARKKSFILFCGGVDSKIRVSADHAPMQTQVLRTCPMIRPRASSHIKSDVPNTADRRAAYQHDAEQSWQHLLCAGRCSNRCRVLRLLCLLLLMLMLLLWRRSGSQAG